MLAFSKLCITINWKTECFQQGFETFIKPEISFYGNAGSLISHIEKFTTDHTKLKFW